MREASSLTPQRGDFLDYAVASDAELSVAIVKDERDQVVRATVSDGRGLPGTWPAPGVISGPTGTARRVHRESIHVVGELALAVWLEDRGSPSSTRLVANRLVGGAWQGPVAVPDAQLPAGADVLEFSAVMKRGTSGAPYVALLFAARVAAAPTVQLFVQISADGGATYGAPVAASSTGAIPGGSATAIGGVSVDMQRGELHLAWSDDRAGTLGAYYRRGIMDFFGRPLFAAPLGTADRLLSAREVRGAVICAVNGEFRWSGTNQKYVGVAWLDRAPGGNYGLQVRASHDSGLNFLPTAPVAHTTRGDVAVAGFDFEVVGDNFSVCWQDNAQTGPNGTVLVPSPPTRQVWRAESTDGGSFQVSGGAVVQQMSAQEHLGAAGESPRIARSFGTPDGCMIAFLETHGPGAEVLTTFSDQEFGGSWHGDEYPAVSRAQGKAPGATVRAPQLCYNARYDNFLVVWAQENALSSGNYDLMLGGYRPPLVEIEGWELGSTSLNFVVEHLPFQDTFAFVMLAAQSTNALSGGFLLPDGRKSGLIPDALTLLGLDAFAFFIAPVDPVLEGAVTPVIPLPGNLPIGLTLSAVGLSWGSFGDLHIVTEPATATIQ